MIYTETNMVSLIKKSGMKINDSSEYIKILIGVLLFVFSFSLDVFGETKEMTIDVNHEYTNAAFSITWEQYDQEADVEIASPDGKTYSKKDTPNAFYQAPGEVVVTVGQAAQGQWKVKVTGNSLGKIDINVGQIPNSLIIDTFTVKENGDKYEAEYSVSDCPDNIYVEIFADTDDKGFDGDEVYSGQNGANGTVELNMERVLSGEYHFYIRISYNGIYKRQYSDSVISYQKKDVTEKVQDVAGGKYNDGYYISWTYENEYDDFKVYVWDKDMNLKTVDEIEGEGFYYGEFDTDENGNDEEKVYLAVVYADKRSNYDKIEVLSNTRTDAEVTFDLDEDITSHKFIEGKVESNGDCIIDAFLNGERKLEHETETGSYRVIMSDGDNEVIFLVTDEDGNKQEFVKKIYVDTVVPALSVTDDLNNLVTSKSYVYVSGYSENGAIVTLNGKEIDLQKGYFNEKVDLGLGKNEIELVACDLAGNKTVYKATVSYEINKKGRMELYILTIISIVLGIIYIVVFARGIKKRRRAK